MKTRDPQQVLEFLNKTHLHKFIEANKNVKWLQWEDFLSKGDKSDFSNLEQVLIKQNANAALETLQISLSEWNYIYKHNQIAIDLLISDANDLKEGIQLLLIWSREIGLFKKRVHDIHLDDKSNLVINLWKDVLFLQMFLVLCKNHKELLLANNMAALMQLSALKNNNAKLFMSLLHAMAEQKSFDQDQLKDYPELLKIAAHFNH